MVECEKCGVIMKSCKPFRGRILCADCIKIIRCKPELNESVCGNGHKGDNFWRQNENDNIVKILEGE